MKRNMPIGVIGQKDISVVVTLKENDTIVVIVILIMKDGRKNGRMKEGIEEDEKAKEIDGVVQIGIKLNQVQQMPC